MLAPAQTYCEKWQTCLDQIKSRTTEEEFVKWFKPIVPLEFDGKTLRLCVPNMSYVYQIEKHYIPFLRPIISQLYGQEIRLHYAVPKNDAQSVPVSKEADTTAISQFSTQTNTANIKNPFVIPGLKKIVIDPQLNPNYTFATFIEGECNRLARSAGMAVAVDPGHTPFNPLYIYGNSGLGKTHIVQSIGHEVRQRHPELQVLYVSMNKFQAQFQTAYKNGEIPDFIHFYQMIDVLIIDDIQELTGKTGTQNAFFNIFNHLQLAGKQLILTSDKPPVELKDIEQRLLTRFKWGLSTQLNTPDYDTKVKIIRIKAQKLGLQLTDEIVRYLADNISANVREIEGPGSQYRLYGQESFPVARQGDSEGLCPGMPKRDHNRAHHRSRLRLPAYRHPAPQFARTNPRSGSGASDRHVPGQAAHQIPADRHRFGYRRTQPRHGVALLQGGIEPDRNGQGFSATDGRARKTGPGITRRDFFHSLPNHKFAKNLPTARYFR